jgi:hypothetical protein
MIQIPVNPSSDEGPRPNRFNQLNNIRGFDHKQSKRLGFTSEETLERVERLGDIFARVFNLKQSYLR